MALTQMQIIQSLGEAMTWFEREQNWGVPATELRHLTGRIGELYTALITNGQMATLVNQSGYDVVSKDGERISVKTTSMKGNNGHISFNPNTLESVDRIVILKINTEEMQIETLLDKPINDAKTLMSPIDKQGKRSISLSKLIQLVKPSHLNREMAKVKAANSGDYEIIELETGTINIYENGNLINVTKPILRKLAKEYGISLVNQNGNPYNTRQLGSILIKEINSN